MLFFVRGRPWAGVCALILLATSSLAFAAKTYPVDQVLPETVASALQKNGIADTGALLIRAKNARSRRALAAALKTPQRSVEEWVALADLLRVPGVGPEMAKLLMLAGTRSVARLGRAGAKALFKRMIEANKKFNVSQNPPVPSQVAHWIGVAKKLPRIVR